ncbi:MAG TPA: hypothetical protein VI731_09625 [Bacteroidia bacterium]|nr:hypothetical protein [Bacteroidia bacterium]
MLILLFAHGCREKKVVAANDPLASDRNLKVSLHPFWGGGASCELERKNGRDKITYSYLTNDSAWSGAGTIARATADSIFTWAETVNWNAAGNFGTADAKTQLTVEALYKKGRIEKSVYWERLKNVKEIYGDLLKILQVMNRIAPEECKLF